MPKSNTQGILITCDAAMREYILHLDDEMQSTPQGGFVLRNELDETHLLVKQTAVTYIQEKVKELQVSSACLYLARQCANDETDACAQDSVTFAREDEILPEEKRAREAEAISERGSKGGKKKKKA